METASEPELAEFAKAAQSGDLPPMEDELGCHHSHKVHKECERDQHSEGCEEQPRQLFMVRSTNAPQPLHACVAAPH